MKRSQVVSTAQFNIFRMLVLSVQFSEIILGGFKQKGAANHNTFKNTDAANVRCFSLIMTNGIIMVG